MYFSKKNLETVEEAQTDIWVCSQEGCTCWMRNSYSFDETPVCPFCSSSMSQSTRLLPVLGRP